MPSPLTLGDVVAKFPPEVRERYLFHDARYVGALQPITGIICREHGPFQQYAAQLRKGGSGCPSCGAAIRVAKRRSAPEDVITQARKRHNGFYTYERAVYVNSATPFIVTCPVHGDFKTAPNNHISGGKGCPVCGAAKRGYRADVTASARKTADTKLAAHAAEFEAEARAVHGEAYDYRQVIYAGQRKAVTILCPKHGAFSQSPEHHLRRAQGCPGCSQHRSKGEAQILAFVSAFADARGRDRTILAPKELDIYVPSAALAIEYCGEYWHGLSSVEEERAGTQRHADKHRDCAELGVRLLTIYESEWLERPRAIKRIIRNALGRNRGRLMARKCELRKVGLVEAADFFEAYHPQGGAGYGESYGLYYAGRLVACMRFTLGANDRGAHASRTWTLSRFATRLSVAGGASRLFKAFANEHNPPSVKSFSDNRYFTGGMYAKLGFVLEEETGPDYQVYHPRTGLLAKSAWQRRKIPARIRDLGREDVFDPVSDPRSERDMTYLLGARRLFDCGKKRWVWRPHGP